MHPLIVLIWSGTVYVRTGDLVLLLLLLTFPAGTISISPSFPLESKKHLYSW